MLLLLLLLLLLQYWSVFVRTRDIQVSVSPMFLLLLWCHTTLHHWYLRMLLVVRMLALAGDVRLAGPRLGWGCCRNAIMPWAPSLVVVLLWR